MKLRSSDTTQSFQGKIIGNNSMFAWVQNFKLLMHGKANDVFGIFIKQNKQSVETID